MVQPIEMGTIWFHAPHASVLTCFPTVSLVAVAIDGAGAGAGFDGPPARSACFRFRIAAAFASAAGLVGAGAVGALPADLVGPVPTSAAAVCVAPADVSPPVFVAPELVAVPEAALVAANGAAETLAVLTLPMVISNTPGGKTLRVSRNRGVQPRHGA
ncbi:hypothetical protein FTUN_6796 [Frigoriglobus tundricola]|uniref:Uncharacterized protein n=1 Tax=Frigoriglobus tundricola TaxID=2774151 RepID=A0A6M5Z0D3_9BACT|nr:hypothetical protein FTUN_6796 [Frigoriglobus tundricola]